MAQIACSYCGADNGIEAPYCSRCQRPLKAPAARPTVRISTQAPAATREPSAPRQGPPPQKAPPPRAGVPQARATAPLTNDLDGPTRVGPPPQFAARPPSAPQAKPWAQSPASLGTPQGPSRRPLPQGAPAMPRSQPNTKSAADDAQDDKTQITPARLSPLMQRLTPKAEAAAAQTTAMLTPSDLAPRTKAPPSPVATQPKLPVAPHVPPTLPPRPSPRVIEPADAKTVIGPAPKALPPLPPSAPAVQVPLAPATPVAQTVILQVPSAQAVHTEETVIASTPLGAPAHLHQDPTVHERAPATPAPYHKLERPRAELEPAPSRQSVHLPQQALDSETTVGARKLAGRGQLALAHGIDAMLVTFVGWTCAATEMVLFDGSWPAERSGLEGLAVWAHMYRQTAGHALLLTLVFALLYSALGAHGGQTLGRWVLGLTLIRTSGDKPSWPWALWHAASSLVATALSGAGVFWVVVDTRRRTLGNILSQSVVCLD